MLSSVQETLLFLLEAAPGLDENGVYRGPPANMLPRWKKARAEFIQKWRNGGPRQRTVGRSSEAQAPTRPSEESEVGASSELGKASDAGMEAEKTTSETAAGASSTQNLGPEAPVIPPEVQVENVKNDALFRAQRISGIAASLKALVPDLPSTYFTDEKGESHFISDPHNDENLAKRLEMLTRLSDETSALLRAHQAELQRFMKSVDKQTERTIRDIAALSVSDVL